MGGWGSQKPCDVDNAILGTSFLDAQSNKEE